MSRSDHSAGRSEDGVEAFWSRFCRARETRQTTPYRGGAQTHLE